MMPNMTVEMDKPSIVNLPSFNKCVAENLEALQVISLSFLSDWNLIYPQNHLYLYIITPVS